MHLFRRLKSLLKDKRGVLNVTPLLNGRIMGEGVTVDGIAWAASQVVKNKGGKFVYMNDGAATLCLDAVAYIFGWANERERTPTVGDLCSVNVGLDVIYRIPVNSGTFVVGMIGDLCDLSISSSIQGAQLDASTENLLIVCGGDTVGNKYVDVKINPAVQGAAAGVA